MYKRILAVGDIHGEWEKLQSLYSQIHFNHSEDLLIFLGDYIDRGKSSLRVLEWVYEMSKTPNVITLRGNHEQMMIDYFNGKDEGLIWVMCGGDITLTQMKQAPYEKFAALLLFVMDTSYSCHIEAGGKKFFFCHAGVRPGTPLEKQNPQDLIWIREEFYNHYDGEEIIVAGHTPTCNITEQPAKKFCDFIIPDSMKKFYKLLFRRDDKYIPVVRHNCILTDTGSYLPHGKISCVDVLSGEVWQSR